MHRDKERNTTGMITGIISMMGSIMTRRRGIITTMMIAGIEETITEGNNTRIPVSRGGF
jgi:hypothetical protein